MRISKYFGKQNLFLLFSFFFKKNMPFYPDLDHSDINIKFISPVTKVNNKIQYNAIQYNTIQYNTIQYNTIQYNTIQYNTKQ